MRHLLWLAIVLLLTGCGQSALDQCLDAATRLWNPEINDNRYEGNEAYWDAATSCEDRYG